MHGSWSGVNVTGDAFVRIQLKPGGTGTFAYTDFGVGDSFVNVSTLKWRKTGFLQIECTVTFRSGKRLGVRAIHVSWSRSSIDVQILGKTWEQRAILYSDELRNAAEQRISPLIRE
jgi:hypothetical protein